MVVAVPIRTFVPGSTPMSHANRRLAALMVALLAAPAAAPAQPPDPAKERLEKSPRHHEWADIKAESGRTVRAFVVYPEVDRPAPAVVVIHENRGLTDFERSVADLLAEAGYVAVAPDLLSGTGPGGGNTDSFASGDAAREGIYKLTPEQVTADLDAVVKYARDLDATTDKVAVAGFCWGGGQCFRYATHNKDVAAAFVFYGVATEADAMKAIAAPVYGFYGGKDFRISGQVPEVEKAMKAAGKTYEPVIYDGAGHGFFRAGAAPNANADDRKAREEAWTRWKEKLQAIGPE
jgi:carboxymethylenebutenolidase